MSEIKVNSIKGVGATDAAITVNNTDGTCTANITNNLSNRRLTINGAMTISQRGTSSTGTGYQTVDRFSVSTNSNDESPTSAQVDVASGTTPYILGFRKALRMTNGNQTSGAGTPDIVSFNYRLEAQDIANSGWNYTSSSSYITLSFWCKSSVAQNFFGHLKTTDGTAYNYPFETGSLSADTWTKITKTIQGNSNLQFDNDENEGLKIVWFQFAGTDRTASSATLNQWAAYDAAARTPDQTSTWYTTNDATFELTGVQLEVGSFATDFEHRSFGQELALCQRYFYRFTADNGDLMGLGMSVNANNHYMLMRFPQPMRIIPSYTGSSGTNLYFLTQNTTGLIDTSNMVIAIPPTTPNPDMCIMYGNTSGTGTAGQAALVQSQSDGIKMSYSAEL